MNIKQQNIIFWAFISVILLISTFIWIDKYSGTFIRECFGSYKYMDTGSPNTSHSVDLPINNPIDCSNMCGPLGRCYKTGEQCTSDIDCPGCNPKRANSIARRIEVFPEPISPDNSVEP